MVRRGKFGVHAAGIHAFADFFQQCCGIGRIVGRQLSRILGLCDEYFHGGRGGAGAHSRYGIRSSRYAAENISAAILCGAAGCILLGFMQHWLWFLILFVLAKSGYSLSLVVYDSMLCDVTQPERMDEVSSRGYAWGYIGSCAPFLVTVVIYVLYAMAGLLSMFAAMLLVFIVIAAWWVGCSFPLWKSYRQEHFVEACGHPVRTGLANLGGVFKEVARNKKVLFFLIAFFFFIDGVYTIIDMATAYGTSLGLDTTMLLIALLVTQIVAFPSAILLGMLSRKIKPQFLIMACIVAYFFITVYAVFLDQIYEFWILAVCVGLFQGTIQAMSRAYFAKIIPPQKAGEYFGIYDIFGKGAAFMGTLLVGIVTDATGNQSFGVGALAVMFVIGFVFFIIAVRCKETPVCRVQADSPCKQKDSLAE